MPSAIPIFSGRSRVVERVFSGVFSRHRYSGYGSQILRAGLLMKPPYSPKLVEGRF
jgi:hypothetical protein